MVTQAQITHDLVPYVPRSPMSSGPVVDRTAEPISYPSVLTPTLQWKGHEGDMEILSKISRREFGPNISSS